MFSYTGLTPEQVDRLREEFAVYLVRSGRMCVAGLNSRNVDYVAEAMAAVLKLKFKHCKKPGLVPLFGLAGNMTTTLNRACATSRSSQLLAIILRLDILQGNTVGNNTLMP
jgi:hypothetical protein